MDCALLHPGYLSDLKLKRKGIDMETIIPLSELQSQAKKIVERVKNTRDTVIITQRGRPTALLVSYEDYEGMVATLEEMSQPDWRARLAEAERDSRVGKGSKREEFKPRRATCGTMQLNCSHGRKKS
jgi:antitoxin YefM